MSEKVREGNPPSSTLLPTIIHLCLSYLTPIERHIYGLVEPRLAAYQRPNISNQESAMECIRLGWIYGLIFLAPKRLIWAPLVEEAVKYGHVEVVQWVVMKKRLTDFSFLPNIHRDEKKQIAFHSYWRRIIESAEKHKPLMDWLLRHCYDWHKSKRFRLLAHFHRLLLADYKWVSQYTIIDLPSIARCGAAIGYISLMEWACERNHSGELDTINLAEVAIQHGHLAVLQWIAQRDLLSPILDDLIGLAIRYGHLHILQWLCRRRTHPHCWSDYVCLAAKYGHIAILEWTTSQAILEQKPLTEVKWDGQSLLWFIMARSISEWIRQPTSPGKLNTKGLCREIYIIAIEFDHLEVLRWMTQCRELEYGWTWNVLLNTAAFYRNITIMEWLAQKGANDWVNALDHVESPWTANRGRATARRWLLQHME